MASSAANIIELKPSDVKAYLIEIARGLDPKMTIPVENNCLVGPPGIGKSSIIQQVAEEMGCDFNVSLPALEDTTEPGGIPWFAADHTRAHKLLFENAYRAVNAAGPMIWHLEDFGQAPDGVQKGYMQWAQAREVNGHKLPPYVMITMATNRRTDKAGVTGILEPVKGRFTMLHMRSDLDDFVNNLLDRGLDYGLEEDMISAGAAFIRFRPELLNKFEATADLTNSPTERNWVSAFRHAQRRMAPHIEHAAVAGRVGSGAAAEFLGFMRIYRDLPDLDAIIIDPMNAIIPTEPSARYAVASGLAGKANPNNFGAICKYVERLEKAKLAEYGVMLARDSIRRTPAIVSTQAFIKLASGTIGKFLTGRAA